MTNEATNGGGPPPAGSHESVFLIRKDREVIDVAHGTVELAAKIDALIARRIGALTGIKVTTIRA
jgi:hypothetical protein